MKNYKIYLVAIISLLLYSCDQFIKHKAQNIMEEAKAQVNWDNVALDKYVFNVFNKKKLIQTEKVLFDSIPNKQELINDIDSMLLELKDTSQIKLTEYDNYIKRFEFDYFEEQQISSDEKQRLTKYLLAVKDSIKIIKDWRPNYEFVDYYIYWKASIDEQHKYWPNGVFLEYPISYTLFELLGQESISYRDLLMENNCTYEFTKRYSQNDVLSNEVSKERAKGILNDINSSNILNRYQKDDLKRFKIILQGILDDEYEVVEIDWD